METTHIDACPRCGSATARMYGKDRNGIQRWKCRDCGRVWNDKRNAGNNWIALEKVLAAQAHVRSGRSLRFIEREVGIRMDIRNTADLRKVLVETIGSVRSGDIEPRVANSIALLSGKVLQSARLDLEMARLSKQDLVPEPVHLIAVAKEPAALPAAAPAA